MDLALDHFMRFFLVALLLAASPLFAQSGERFAPGSVITIAGDTLRGEIALVPDEEKARGVTFRTTPDAAPTSLTHQDIQSYQIDGGSRFVHRWVDFNADATRGAHVFLRVLVPGPRTLYAYHSLTDEDAFYIEGIDFPVEGLFELTSRRGATRSRQVKLWVGTLNRAFQACRAVLDHVATARFRERDLVDLTVRYNECVEPNYRYVPPVEQVDRQSSFVPHLWVEVAGGLASVDRESRTQRILTDDDGMTSFALRGLLLVEILALPSTVYGVVEAGLQRVGTAQASRLTTTGAPEFQLDTLDTNYAPIAATLGLGLQYELPLQPVSPFVRASYVFAWAALGSRDLDFNDTITTYGGPALSGGVHWDRPAGPSFSVGVRLERHGISKQSVYVPFEERLGQQNTYSLVLGVRL